MAPTALTHRRSRRVLITVLLAALAGAGLGPLVLVAMIAAPRRPGHPCEPTSGPVGHGADAGRVGATEYGGPGDPSSGTVGSSGVDLSTHPDSYAELGGTSFSTATALGGLAYETPLRISWGGHTVIAYKRDIGLGGGPIDGLPREIDLWWQLAGALSIPYDDGQWSGAVEIGRPPATGAGDVLGASDEIAAPPGSVSPTGVAPADCPPAAGGGTGTPTTSGPRAQLLPDGRAAAPAGAPDAVKGMIAAGNEIVGKPYVYGGGHGIPLSEIAPSYDCSSSVAHLLWGGGLLPADDDVTSSTLETWGAPGPGRWVTIYASADHVFVYVAGLRWDTHDAAGPGDGSAGIGWHPLIRESEGFVVRHPVGL
jgi:hypothetical protein